MNMQVLDAGRDVSGGFKVDVSRGERVGRVSSEWFSRPDDERYLSLGDLARSDQLLAESDVLDKKTLLVQADDEREAVELARRQWCHDLPRLWDAIMRLERAQFEIETT